MAHPSPLCYADATRGILRQRDLLFSRAAAISIFPSGVLYSAKQKRIPATPDYPKDYANRQVARDNKSAEKNQLR